MMTIGEAMKKARKKKQLTQRELAIKAQTSVVNICQWETMRAFPTIINLIPIADALNVSLDELVGRSNNEQRKTD